MLNDAHTVVPRIDVAPREVVEQASKMVLGLVWQLVLRFQILAGESDEGGNVMAKARAKVLDWWRAQLADEYADVPITNKVDESFGDGMAILALLHKLDANYVDLEAARARKRDESHDGRRANLELAFALAEQHLVSKVEKIEKYISFDLCWLYVLFILLLLLLPLSTRSFDYAFQCIRFVCF